MKGGVFKQVQVTFMFVLLVSSTHCQLQYYILPSIGNDQDCPTGKVCHSLSYCINDLKEQHSNNITNVTFIFLSGEHLLNETVILEGYHSLHLSFKGQGQWVQGAHESVNQSTVIIRCTNNMNSTINIAFLIRGVNSVYYDMLTIADCTIGMVLQHINSVHLHHVSVQNNSYTGLEYSDVYNTRPSVGIVESCSFYQNCFEYRPLFDCAHGLFRNMFNRHVLINVTDTTFSFGRYGAGLVFLRSEISNTEYIVTNSRFVNNNGTETLSGGLFLSMYMVRQSPSSDQQQSAVEINVTVPANILTIANCLFINNRGGLAGGMLINSEASFPLSLVVNNTQFVNNSNYMYTKDRDVASYAGGIKVSAYGCKAVNVNITNSLFINNTGTEVGGLYITSYFISTSIHIVHTRFINNYNNFYSESANYGNIAYVGGVALFASSGRVDVNLSNCLFSNNSGATCGGFYIICDGSFDLQAVHIENTNFISNHYWLHNSHNFNLLTSRAKTAGVLLNLCGNITVVNCHFQSNNNTALMIKAVLPPNSEQILERKNSVLMMKNITFNKNFGTSFYLTWYYSVAIADVSVTSTISSYNNSHYGAVFLICQGVTIVRISNMRICNNNMTGLLVIGCSIIFQNSSSIIANNTSPKNGGGIWLDSLSVLESKDENGTVSFTNNTAVLKGGAIYSESTTFPLLNQVYENYPASGLAYSVCSIYNIIATFSDENKSAYGSNIYGGRFSGCLIKTTNRPYNISLFDNFTDVIACSTLNANKKWTIFDHIYQFQPSYVSSDPFGVCQCTDNGTIDCYNRSIYKEVYPGQSISLSLVTVGMCGGVSPGLLAVQADSIDVTLGNSSQQTGQSCKEFIYQLKQSRKINGLLTLHTDSPNIVFGSSLQITISFLQCPLGLQLTDGVCQCNTNLTKSLGDQVKCDINSILRRGNNWLSYSDQYNCTVAHKNCPFDYCNRSTVSLSLDQPDVQCTLNRSGTLCGQCQSGLSLMLGSNQCGSCDNKYLSLVAVFTVAGIALVVFLLVCNLTVSMGSINGLLFYANIVKLNEPVFFPNGVSIPVLSQFISWLNLDLGIQTCFFNGLDGYWKTWLQFVFPIYIWLLIGGIIIGSHYFGRVSRLFGNNTVPALATLVLMSYSKLLRTITNVLMVATIQCGAKQWNVWSVDGNIHYLNGKHAPLFVIALAFLLIGILYTFLVFTTQWLQRYSGRYCRSSYDPVVKLKPLIDAYSGPYKDKHRYWTGLLLIVRVIVTAIFSYTSSVTPQMNNYIIIVVVGLISLKLSQGVYRNALLNRLELFFILNLALLSLLSALCSHMKWNVSSFISFASVALNLVIFLAIVCIHGAIIIKRKYNITFCWEKKQNTQGEEEEPLLREESPEVELYSPARVINRRESLIFDLNID